MPVVLTQHFLELPHIQLDVVRECSGINHIIALMSLAIPLAYFSDIPRIVRPLLVAFSFFLGIFLNGLRVAMIGLWSVNHKDLHGPVSTLFTSSIFFAGLVVLLLITCLPLSRGRRRTEGDAGRARPSHREGKTVLLGRRGQHRQPGPPRDGGGHVRRHAEARLFTGPACGVSSRDRRMAGKDVEGLNKALERINPDDDLKRVYLSPSGARWASTWIFSPAGQGPEGLQLRFRQFSWRLLDREDPG